MARFHALVLAAVFGAVAGTALRPGVVEILIVAGILVAGAAVVRRGRTRLGRAAA